MSVKCLCKIAILKTNQETDENSVTITHNGKNYEPIIAWDNDYIADVSKHPDFCIVALKCDDAEYLTIFYDGTRNSGNQRGARENILSICFPDFQSTSPMQDQEEDETSKETQIHNVTTKLYSLLKTAHLTEASKYADYKLKEPESLQPKLRNYQRKTVQWLLRRELESTTLNYNFYKKLTAREGCVFYVNILTLDIIETQPKTIVIPSGGILAEEMGLGKTVEMLTLILLNRRVLNSIEMAVEPKTKKPRLKEIEEIELFCVCQSTKLNAIKQCSECFLYQHEECIRSYIDFPLSEDETYICPNCWEGKGILVATAATVIISPISIKLQWLSEINKHTNPPLKVLIYEGVPKHKISPKELASYDIVLTSYTVLRQEVNFTASNETKMTFRNQRRKMRVNSPLTLVDWWRVCMDEAQMESAMSKASQIVVQLPATHRWAVTGTPIQGSLDDLISLLSFIGLDDVSNRRPWQQLTAEFKNGQSDNLIRILQKVMWRTTKADVLAELGVPPQSELTHFVEFNNLEKLFYSDEHDDCLNAFYERIKGYSNLRGVSTRNLKLILQPMLRLRQDCSIPVLCLKSDQNVVKKFLQPQQLLDHMKSANEVECKNHLRSMASTYNGMAALNFLKKNYQKAINYYESVISLSKKYTENVSVDSLLQIHALHNAIQAYRTINPKDTPIIEEYETQGNRLECKYLETYAKNLKAARDAYGIALSSLKQNDKNPKNIINILERLLQGFQNERLENHLVSKINDEVFLLYSSSQYERFQTINTVLFVIDIWYKKISKVRKQLFNKFNSFENFVQNVRARSDVPVAEWRVINEFIQSVYECHIEKKKDEEKREQKKTRCELCVAQQLLQTYECLIFDKTLDEKTSNAEGTWNPTMQETVLKSVFSAIRLNRKLKWFSKDCELQFEIIALLKTEYKALVKLWIEIEYTVKAYDELKMCKMRISLANDDEERTNFNVFDYEIDSVLAESKVNFDEEQRQFVIKYARLKYICHLEKDSDPGPCPICRTGEHIKYAVLECGHHLCFVCLKQISQMKRTSILICSVCRNEQKYSTVHYVTRKSIQEEGYEILGDYSSKIQKIVLQILKLKSKEKNVKVLIFSHWMQVLKAISGALQDNQITFRINVKPKCVEEFKSEELGITCLLMLLKTKSQGLNLTEATHVFLVEPILNPGEELQAIGRIHRIGQTEPTFVHRFIVQNTIEENIYNSVSKDKTNRSIDLTIDSIKKLFGMHSYNC